jgi:hypothetical protein
VGNTRTVPLTLPEIKLIMRLRRLQNQYERGIIGVVWSPEQLAVISADKGELENMGKQPAKRG